ncbi:MAG TPA: peptidyl-prolyl cis-trans isomerase, partial [Thermoanaerobaculia bacterium]|nr:peptidyl-prolyl cis-trans isomerase [Thermoanaerobaculia bacterium]
RAVVVTDQDVEQRYRQQAEKVKIRYVAIPFAASAGQVQVGDAELQKWFDQHREQYRVPEQRVADYLLVDQSAIERSLPIGEQELRDYYEQHNQEYGQPEQVHARHILVATAAAAATAQARLAGGEDFAKVARETSTDTQSGAQGGDLGWFGKGRMVPAFEEAAFAAPLGKVVGPVKTQFGYHLIEVQERRAAATSSFAEVSGAIRGRLAAERAASEAEAKAKNLAAELTKAGGNVRQKMQELASQSGVELGTTEPFGRQGAVQPLGMSPTLNAAAFQLKKGGVAEPQRSPRGWVVLHLADVKPPHLPPLAAVKEAVRRDAEQDKARQQAFERLQAARAKLGAGGSLDAVAAEVGLPVQESQEFGYGAVIPGLGYAPDLAKEAIAKPVGTLGGPTAVAGSAVLYQVSGRQGFDPAVYAQQKDGLRQQLEQEQLNGLVSSLVSARKQEMGVTYDPALLKSMGIEGQQPPQRG